MQLLLVGLGGFVGALMRYGITRALVAQSISFPYATLVVNLLGSFVLGLLAVLITQKFIFAHEIRLAVQIGLLGALTTFSTFSLDTMNLLLAGSIVKGLLNIVLNVVLCLFAVGLGMMLAKQV